MAEAAENEPKKEGRSLNFIETKIEENLKAGLNDGRVHTRFPPEPNGYLHIGHAKSICLNFGLAQRYNGNCNLRFDDTNPSTEDVEYVDSIRNDVKWLGFEWAGEYFASDYFEQLYEYAIRLIKKGKAFICDLSPEEIAAHRGTPTVPGKESPFRKRSVEENLELFQKMRNGEFKEGTRLLRAKIDMSSPNMHMRDPILYRIRFAKHHRTGDKWCIYPMYDFAHGQSDYIEGITHSICTLEFEVHRPLYDWLINNIFEPGEMDYRPRQTEFARLNLSYTVMSKRKLLQLVNEKYVEGWDDPRMPTISAMRRRGYTPEAIRNFSERVGVARRDNLIDVALLEHSVREDLNKKAPRVFAVLNPLKLVITNYPEGQVEELETDNNPEDPNAGTRKVPFSRELYIERDDFLVDPPKKYFRLAPEKEVRLKSAYIIKAERVIKDDDGNIVEVHCTYDPQTKSGSDTSGKKVKGTLHWVSAAHALNAEVRLYDRLFVEEDPAAQKDFDFKDFINPQSLVILKDCKLEPGLSQAKPGDKFQFQRIGYFCVDNKHTKEDKLVFNRTVSLKDTWSKLNK